MVPAATSSTAKRPRTWTSASSMKSLCRSWKWRAQPPFAFRRPIQVLIFIPNSPSCATTRATCCLTSSKSAQCAIAVSAPSARRRATIPRATSPTGNSRRARRCGPFTGTAPRCSCAKSQVTSLTRKIWHSRRAISRRSSSGRRQNTHTHPSPKCLLPSIPTAARATRAAPGRSRQLSASFTTA